MKHVDPATERRYKRYFGLGLAALLLPSAFILYNTVTASVQSNKLQGFVSNTIQHPGVEVVKREVVFEDGLPVAHVVLLELFPETSSPSGRPNWHNSCPTLHDHCAKRWSFRLGGFATNGEPVRGRPNGFVPA